MKYYVIAGEASGDLHASNLAMALLKQDSSLQLIGWGGDLMVKEGVKISTHFKDLAFMGFWEVAKNIRTIFKNIQLIRFLVACGHIDRIPE
jgi:lipid-A-disaccharide synthase